MLAAAQSKGDSRAFGGGRAQTHKGSGPQPASSSTLAVEPSSDDRMVEAALQSPARRRRRLRPRQRLEWKLERTRRALDDLEARLQSTGARLHRNDWQQCAIRPATQHLADDQQQALHRIGPRDRGLNHITARLLLSATCGELDDRWFKTASNSERVALQRLLKQRVLLTLPGQTEIIPAPEMIDGLDLLNNSRHLTEETETSALNNS